MNGIQIFDTTLRDGEQSPGTSMSIAQKLTIAHKLADMGVDIIEAGFPISSSEQFIATQRIANEVRTSTIAGLARAVEKDIDTVHEAVKGAVHPRIHVFLASSPIHRQYKLKKNKEEICTMTQKAVSYARNKCDDIEFSPEDATRTELNFLSQVVDIAIKAGATTVNIPDTVGYTTPGEMAEIIRFLKNNVANIDKAVISTHCHNDLGLAVANSLSAVEAGARQIEVTVNGIGERAGNAALEEVVMALTVRKDMWSFSHTIKTENLYAVSKLVSTMTGLPIPRNKAVVGENAFAHESGVHQDGVLKHRETYEIMNAQMIGRATNSIVLGRHSGMHGLMNRMCALGLELDSKNMDELYKKFLHLADKKKEVYDEDLYALVHDVRNDEKQLYELLNVNVFLNADAEPKACVTIAFSQESKTCEETGDGPVDAIFVAIAKACGHTVTLKEFHINAVTPGTDALGEAMVIVTIGEYDYTGRYSSTDILDASAHAYLSAINNYMLRTQNTPVN